MLEDTMLFHVTAAHDHMTCPGREGGAGSDAVRDAQKWLEGNDEVAVTALLRQPMLMGITEVLPVNDGIANRKTRGWWGK